MIIINYAILFFIYSFIGWVVEVFYTRITTKKWVNRGFLIGPICPIYGIGCLLLVFLFDSYRNDYFVLFLSSIFICSLLEYTTSFLLEKIFKARWWDYSHMKYNINGRICLETMLPFGLFGALVAGLVNPFFYNLISRLPKLLLIIISSILLVILLVDLIISFSVVSKIKGSLKFLEADNTEEIKKKIKKFITNQSFLHRRFFKAFPELFSKLLHLNVFEALKDNIKKRKDK